MAVIKNVTKGALTLGIGGPPVYPGDEVTMRDQRVVGRAWPKSTWEVVEPPEGYVDVGPEDAYVFVAPEDVPDEPPATWLEQWAADHPAETDGRMADPSAYDAKAVVQYLAHVDDDERARVIAAETDGKARKSITEWSE